MSLVDYPVINIAIGAAILAVIYGLVMSKWIINLPAGNAKMKEIAGAIQDGAAAFLTRQYKTIGIVGIILAALFITLLIVILQLVLLLGQYYQAYVVLLV